MALIAAVVIIACLLGLFTYKGPGKSKTSHEIFDTEKINGSHPLKEITKDRDEVTIKPLIPESESLPEILPESLPESLIDKKLAEASNLRDELLIKYQNIVDLKKHYQNGILEVENNILMEMLKVKTTSFDKAVKNKKIGLDLRIIQRRQSYIQKLDQPLKQLHMAIEELLYIKRLTKIDMLSGCIFGDVDQEKLIDRIDSAIKKHISKTDGLSIETNGVISKSLEMIWKKIVEKEKILKEQKTYFSLENKTNQKIWQEICNGNFQRKNELTRLSPEAAKCLAKYSNKDLYLGGLTRLSPEAAKNLSAWQGKWLLLNGIAELSPEAAKNLSAWQGDRLSLNGLKILEDETAIYLLQWRGLQLELSGLRRLANWEKSGGRLYLPERYKRRLDKIIKSGTP